MQIYPAAIDLHVGFILPPGAVAHAVVRSYMPLLLDGTRLELAADGGAVQPAAAIQKHEFEAEIADRDHRIPQNRPQDRLSGELPPFEASIPP